MCRVKARVLQGKPAVTESAAENKLPRFTGEKVKRRCKRPPLHPVTDVCMENPARVQGRVKYHFQAARLNLPKAVRRQGGVIQGRLHQINGCRGSLVNFHL